MNATHWVLSINPGSTSTKIAVYADETLQHNISVDHPAEDLAAFFRINEQYAYRRDAILAYLRDTGFDLQLLSAVSGRGGGIPPCRSGAYQVNQRMLDRLRDRPAGEHVSNLGAALAHEIAGPLRIPAFIYDGPAVDELSEVAKVSGVPDFQRRSLCHALNMRAMAMRVARKLGRPYADLNLLVVHLGGGITMSVHEKGRMVDVIRDDEGPFSPERAGKLPCMDLVNLCFNSGLEKAAVHKKVRGAAGLLAYLGTTDVRKVEESIRQGDRKAEVVYEAMIYQVAKGIGELATVLKGRIDRIVITGGIAYSKVLVPQLVERIAFLAPVEIEPGENELEALAYGALRVLRGEESAYEYDEAADNYVW